MNFTLLKKGLPVSISVFFFIFFIYLFSNHNLKNNYKHQVLLADSLVKGRCDLISNPLNYHDVFPVKGKLYTAFSPLPILFLTPLTMVFGTNTNQVLLSIIIGALNSAILYLILKKLKINLKNIYLIMVAFSLGTINWYASVIGTSWYFSHIIAVFCLLLSLYFIFDKKIFIAGLFFGFAFASRFPIITALPALLVLITALTVKNRLKKILTFIGGIFPGLLIIFSYNYCRFGSLWETGYTYANLVYTAYEPTPSFSLQYLPRNLYIFLFKGYDFISQFPWLNPDPQGLSIFLTSPFLIFAFKAGKNKKITLPFWTAVLSIAAVVLTYFLTGWYQFGYRFLLDFLPFLIILTALGMEKINSNLVKLSLISISIVFNALGVYWGLKLGW
ncbi:hypothetical protein A3J78_02090 [Candidatus Beckwithbacteria bacterium RBG_13_35_6]|uniref:Glycosyltransferase RgtA/B/C/D-like domain-containing protein n=1 Tax=Candidatus Beckwithbacteria bacterium RBG_13_35_6 TaxID=1797456 RepID=A0A1F5DEU6_9BACT|nr:MAG: hypothetical protein A3J78_02090 [Candidatus Beckwithbacteria bacterium RBG_13_35_6]